jgi:16S rRNA (cytidine1402-2'-O)-methyltransferase
MPGSLYIVATPIGNLDDITQRALEVLKQVQLIACEDTRHTRKLLTHYGISTPTISYHEHNELQRAEQLMERLEAGASIAIVSDAGTPGVNDPGFRVVSLAIEKGIGVVPIPGASAPIAALVSSGLPTDEFFFGGFLPPKKNARRAKLSELRPLHATLVFFEAPHRIAATLQDAVDVLGPRRAVVARELTKLHEEFVRGTLNELAAQFSDSGKARGEMVLLIERAGDEQRVEGAEASVGTLVSEYKKEGLDHRAALKKAARALGLTRDEAYRRLMAEKELGR